MKALTRMMLLGLAMVAVAGNVGAADKGDVASLEDSRDQLAWQAHNERGVEKVRLKGEEERLQGLIDTLNQGGRVDPAEVDRALNRAR